MKILLLVFFLCIGITSQFNNNPISEAWRDFKRIYNRRYGSAEEEIMRKLNFQKNYIEIIKHNAQNNLGGPSFFMGVNHFSDLSAEEWFNRVNCALGYPHNFTEVRPPVKSMRNIPDQFSWLDLGLVTSVKDQLNCCSAYAFATVSIMETMNALKHNSRSPWSISAQNIVDCGVESNNQGCLSGSVENALNYAATREIYSEEYYPYKGQNSPCRINVPGPTVQVKNIGYFMRNPSDIALQQVILEGPVSAVIDTPKSFMHYNRGVFYDPDCGKSNPNHAVTIIGWGTDKASGQDFWLLKNSWGEDWGEKGYMRIARRGSVCGIKNHIHTGVTVF